MQAYKKLFDYSYKNPFVVFISVAILYVACAAGGLNLYLSTSSEIFFSDKNPELNEFNEFNENYQSNDNVYFVINLEEGSILSEKGLKIIDEVTRKVEEIPYFRKVLSITNHQFTNVIDEEISTSDVYVEGTEVDEDYLNAIKAMLNREQVLINSLISKDFKTAGVNIIFDYPQEQKYEVIKSVEAAKKIAAEFEKKYHVNIAVTGLSAINYTFYEATMRDAMTLIPLMILLMVVIAICVLRVVSTVFITLTIVGIASGTASGVLGYFNVALTPVSLLAPTVVMSIAIANGVHVMRAYHAYLAESKDKKVAILSALMDNLFPVTITTLTTVVGFLSLNFADAPPFWHLGNTAALGIMVAWLLTLILIPAMVAFLPTPNIKNKADTSYLERLCVWLSQFILSNYKMLGLLSLIVSIAIMAMIPKNRVNDRLLTYFDNTYQLRQDSEFADKKMEGVYQIEFSIPADGPGGINEPEYLENLEKFVAWLKSYPKVSNVFSFLDIVKQLNFSMNDSDMKFFSIPESRDVSEENLFLYELSLSDGQDINDRIANDKEATRLTVNFGWMDNQETHKFIEDSKNWLMENTPEYMHTEATGTSVMFSNIFNRNTINMLKGNLFSVCIITLLLILAFRRISFGLLSILPNILPILMTFGVWALINGQIGLAASSVSAAALGIIVDDTIHYISKYLKYREQYGPKYSIEQAYKIVGPAMISTSFILVSGFLVLASSSFRVDQELGLLCSISISLALLFDLITLPSIILFFEEKFGSGVATSDEIMQSNA